MNKNKLCAGLVLLLLCVAAMPVCAKPGLSGGAPVQSRTAQGFLLANRAVVTLGVVTAGLGAYGLYRWWHKRWSERAHRDRLLQGSTNDLQAFVNASDDPCDSNDFAQKPTLFMRVIMSREQVEREYRKESATLSGLAIDDAERAELRAKVQKLDGERKNLAMLAVHLIKCGRVDVDKTDSFGQTALTHAAKRGDASAVAALCAMGADPNHLDGMQCIPSTWAAQGVTEERELDHTILYTLSRYGAMPLTESQYESTQPAVAQGANDFLVEELRQLRAMTEKVSLGRKNAIESTLDEIKVCSKRLSRDLKRLIISLSEHRDVITWWRQVELGRLRAVSHMRLPIEALKRIVMFDSPQDIGLFRGLVE